MHAFSDCHTGSSKPGLCARVALCVIRFYQRFISPLLPQACRYEPTCSEYMATAIKRKGVMRGVIKGAWRLCRCHPLARGGWDPVDQEDVPCYLGKTTLSDGEDEPQNDCTCHDDTGYASDTEVKQPAAISQTYPS